MLNRQILAGLSTLALVATQAPVQADDLDGQHELSLMYFMQVMPGCGMQEPAFARAPFAIVGDKIKGYYKFDYDGNMPIDVLPMLEDFDDPDMPEVFTVPGEPLHEINYSWTCMACTETGTLLYHRVWGGVETFSGEKQLHFFVSHSRPFCKNNCMVPSNDCSDREIVTDEFITPIENGYIVDRGAHAPFKYALRLQ